MNDRAPEPTGPSAVARRDAVEAVAALDFSAVDSRVLGLALLVVVLVLLLLSGPSPGG